MKRLLIFVLMVVAAPNASSARAEQLPVVPPTDWALSIRFYGTSDAPGSDWCRIVIHTNGTAPSTISVAKPVYNDSGKMRMDSPHFDAKLDQAKCDALYAAARATILGHQTFAVSKSRIEDGDSVEITMSSYDKKISVGFDHNSSENSKEFKALIDLLKRDCPEAFMSHDRRGMPAEVSTKGYKVPDFSSDPVIDTSKYRGGK